MKDTPNKLTKNLCPECLDGETSARHTPTPWSSDNEKAIYGCNPTIAVAYVETACPR